MRLLSGVFAWTSVAAAAAADSGGVSTFPLTPHRAAKARESAGKRALLSRTDAAETALFANERGRDGSDVSAMTPEQEELYRSSYPRRRRGSNGPRGLAENDAPEHETHQAEQISPLFQGYGTHYVDLWCGTPPQRQTVIVDTGSSVTAFPCAGCQDCGAGSYHIDQVFRESQSSSFQQLHCDACTLGKCTGGQPGTCKMHMGYAEGSSWTAYEAIDTCYLGGPHLHPDAPSIEDSQAVLRQEDALNPHRAAKLAFPLDLGCQTSVKKLFKTQLADGIMGMDFNDSSYWNQMYRAGKMGSLKQFSLCYSRQPLASRKGTESGSITLGGTDERMHRTPMVYTDHAEDEGFFAVKIRKIYLRDGATGGEYAKPADPNAKIIAIDMSEKELNHNGVIVDSGTTDTYWEKRLSPAFHDAYKAMTGQVFDNTARSLTHEQLLAMPTILFQMHGIEADNQIGGSLAKELDPEHPYDVILAYPATHYMEYDPESKLYTPRFYMSEKDGSVLGANAMMGHDVMFDASNYRLGWAEADCDHTALLEQAGYPFLDEQDAVQEQQPKAASDGVNELPTDAQTETNEDVDPSAGASNDEHVTSSDVPPTDVALPSLGDGIPPAEDTALPVNGDDSEESEATPVVEESTNLSGSEDEEGTEPGTPTGPEESNNPGDEVQDESEEEIDVDKKTTPEFDGDSDGHSQNAPEEDIQKESDSVTAAIGSCNDLTCRGALLGLVFCAMVLGICIGRCCCSARRVPQPLYHKGEAEMTDQYFSSYKDEPDDDAEYGMS